MGKKTETKLVVGLMSGTSADGIDACLVEIGNKFSVKFIKGISYHYPVGVRKKIFDIFRNEASVKDICEMNFVLGECLSRAALEVIKEAGLTPDKVDLIGSHGQTIFHKPSDEFINDINTKSTLQIGEAAIIAERTGITTISDFRPADIAAGGQGAPLVCFADEILFKLRGKAKGKVRAIQNIGGMANVTVVGKGINTFAFDTGPGNVIIDYCAEKFFSQQFDLNGKIAAEGMVDKKWLEILLSEPYYSKTPPKTTGRELFTPKYIEKMLSGAPENPYDIIATATALTATTIYNAYENFVFPITTVDELVIGGGGGFNPTLMRMVETAFGKKAKILKHEDFDIPGKFKEAIAFALLAYATYYRIPNNVPSCTGSSRPKVLGKVSY